MMIAMTKSYDTKIMMMSTNEWKQMNKRNDKDKTPE
jgi:hypothetical protein